MARVQSLWVPRTPSKTSGWAFAEGHPGGRWAMASSFLCLAVRGLRADASAVPAAPCRTGRAGDRGRHVRPRGLGPPSSDNTPGVATSRPCGLRWVESADVEGSPGWFFVQPETLLR